VNTEDRLKLRVADLMTRDVISCRGDADLAAVAGKLARHHIHAVFVLDHAGEPSGVVSDFDLLAGEWMADDAEGLETMRRMTACELKSAPVESIGEDATAAEAAARLEELHVGRLLVRNREGRPAGVISVSDLVAPLGMRSRERRCVRDVMSRAIVTCLPDTSAEDAARAMTERRSRSIVVVDEHGRAVGVITGADLLSLYRQNVGDTVSALMTTPVVTCEAEVTLTDAAELMISREVHRLVVVEPSGERETPIGVVSTADIVAEMAQEGSVWQLSVAEHGT
jgi:CBS domain-containing protein